MNMIESGVDGEGEKEDRERGTWRKERRQEKMK